MSLSKPIYQLKQQAKVLQKNKSIKLVNALNIIAQSEGYNSWSHLSSDTNVSHFNNYSDILAYLKPGDFVLIAGRPGMSKTTFCLRLLVQALKIKQKSCFYSLEASQKSMASKLEKIDATLEQNNNILNFDFSNDISAKYIIDQSSKNNFKYIAVDYLQLLNEKRANPNIDIQLRDLKVFSKKENKIILFISQIDRSFEDKNYNFPKLEDLRLPNPVDIKLFNKIFFLHDRVLKMLRPKELTIKVQ